MCSLYIKNPIWFIVLRLKGNEVKEPVKKWIGTCPSIAVRKQGILIIEHKLYTKTRLHILVDRGSCEIGNNCFFNHNCSITCLEKISIGERCAFCNNAVTVDHDHSIHGEKSEFVTNPVIIEDGVWVVIPKGPTIRKEAVIVAESAVTKNVSPYCIFIAGKYKKKKGEAQDESKKKCSIISLSNCFIVIPNCVRLRTRS